MLNLVAVASLVASLVLGPAAAEDGRGTGRPPFKLQYGSMTGLLPRHHVDPPLEGGAGGSYHVSPQSLRSFSGGWGTCEHAGDTLPSTCHNPGCPPCSPPACVSNVDCCVADGEGRLRWHHCLHMGLDADLEEEEDGEPVDWDFNTNTGRNAEGETNTCPQGQSDDPTVTFIKQTCYWIKHPSIRRYHAEHCVFWFKHSGDPDNWYAVDMTPLEFFGNAYLGDGAPEKGRAKWDLFKQWNDLPGKIPHIRCTTAEHAIKGGDDGLDVEHPRNVPEYVPKDGTGVLDVDGLVENTRVSHLHQYAVEYVRQNPVYKMYYHDCQSFTGAMYRHFTGRDADDEGGEHAAVAAWEYRAQRGCKWFLLAAAKQLGTTLGSLSCPCQTACLASASEDREDGFDIEEIEDEEPQDEDGGSCVETSPQPTGRAWRVDCATELDEMDLQDVRLLADVNEG